MRRLQNTNFILRENRVVYADLFEDVEIQKGRTIKTFCAWDSNIVINVP